MKRILAIINPISGTKKGKSDMPDRIAKALAGSDFKVECRFTERAGHATELALQAVADGYWGVVAVGGDGTINEVASGVRDTDVALGIVPCGSGNGLARHLEIPLNVDKALRVIAGGYTERFDYCLMNDRPFFCTCGVGFDAHISVEFARAKKRGAATYVEKTLTEYFNYRCDEYEIEHDGQVEKERAFVVACGNASQYGNNAFITPRASMQDGKIDVTILRPFSAWAVPVLGALLLTRHLDKHSKYRMIRTSEVTIRRSAPGAMHIDGEPIEEGTELHIKSVPGGLRAIVDERKAQKQHIR